MTRKFMPEWWQGTVAERLVHRLPTRRLLLRTEGCWVSVTPAPVTVTRPTWVVRARLAGLANGGFWSEGNV